MISKRPYRKGIAINEVIETIIHEAGHHFDPEVVNAFLVVMEAEINQKR